MGFRTPRTVTLVLWSLSLALRAGASPAPSMTSCRDLVRDRPGALESYACFRAAAHFDGSFDRAAVELRAIRRRDPGNVLADLVLADLEADRGPGSERAYRDVADRAAAKNDRGIESLALLKLSAVLLRHQRLTDAQAALERAQNAAEKVGSYWPAAVETAQSRIAYARGDYGRAMILLKDAESHLFPDAPRDARASCLSALGATSWALAHFDEAAAAYHRLAALFHDAGDRFGESGALVSGILVSSNRGVVPAEEMRRMARNALELAVLGGNLDGEGRASFYLAQYTSGAEAIGHARRALAIARRLGDVGGIMMGLRAAASLTAREDRPEGFRLIDEAIALAQQHGDLAEVARNRIVRSRISWSLGPRSQAITDSLAALDAVEAERDLQEDSLVKAWRFSAWRTPYYELSGHLLSGHLLEPAGARPSREDLALAFAVIERMRGRMLLDTMDAAHATAAVAPQTTLAARHTALLKEVAELRRRLLDPALPSDERSRATESFQRLAAEEASSRSALAVAAPRFGALRAPHLASLDEVAASLDRDQALLSFQIAIDRGSDQTFLGGSWLLVRTRAAVKIYHLPPFETIWTRVPVLVGLLGRRDGSEAPGSVREFQDLMAAALADLPGDVTRLVILPDGPLHNLPFDVLRPAPGKPPLAEVYEIAIAPSATTWLRWKQSPVRPPAIPALVFADPDLKGVSRKGDSKSPTRDVQLGDLPRAREEGLAVARYLGGGSECFVGSAATESRLKSQNLSSFGVLHFASHAVVDTVFPDRSAVLLARGSAAEDGWLRPRDVVNLNLSGQVVVLSACQTASGALIEGEGVTGLAHSFFQAGAHAVIASLWPLRDDEAARTFETFYRHLSRGVSVGQAMAATRRDLIGAGLPPAVWASPELIGDADARPIARRSWWTAGSPRPLFIAAAALLVLALTGLAVRATQTGNRPG